MEGWTPRIDKTSIVGPGHTEVTDEGVKSSGRHCRIAESYTNFTAGKRLLSATVNISRRKSPCRPPQPEWCIVTIFS